MPVLFDDASLSPPKPGRSATGLWLSVVVHAAIGVIVVAAQFRAPAQPPTPRERSRLVFTLAAADLVKLPPPAMVAPRLAAPKAALPAPEPPKAEAPKPPEPIAPKPVEMPPLVHAAARVVEPPAKPAEVQRPLETGLFERTRAANTNQAAGHVTTGGFSNTATAVRTVTAGAVSTGGFGNAASAPRNVAAGAVTTGGFGTTVASPRTTGASGETQAAGFDRQPSAPQAVAAAAPVRRPVEITFKPTPEYTDEARHARVEGTVSLELDFTAAGDVRIVRVVRGLGHGLDESAQRAALRIRFTPAQVDGGPVDSRATVHITFRLS